MEQTLKMLSAMIPAGVDFPPLNNLALLYQQDESPIYLAVAFDRLFDMTYKLYNTNGTGLTEQDIASYSLECLHYALKSYVAGNAQFSTYYYTIIKNRIRTEVQYLNTNKRIALYNCVSLEHVSWDMFAVDGTPVPFTLDGYGLTDNQRTYCELKLEDYSDAEISREMGVSKPYVCKVQKALKKKMLSLLTF